jgi:amidohydrolase
VLNDPPIESVFALHLINQYPTGSVVVRPGATMASADFFDIEVRGKGGHGAFPHQSIDPITVAAHIVVGLQDLISREIPALDTAVMTVGQITGGTKHNIIPETAHLAGSIRAFKRDIRDQLIERLSSYASRMAQAYRAEAQVSIMGDGTPAVVNDVDITERVRRGTIDLLGSDAVLDGQPMMGSDDMSLFLQERPGCYFWIGAATPGKEMQPHHHPGFEIDEGSLDIGLRVALNAVLDALAP